MSSRVASGQLGATAIRNSLTLAFEYCEVRIRSAMCEWLIIYRVSVVKLAALL